ncbi:CidA/LrgA family protein [Neobacillus rhizosphaerae]|uniref:CidA/LrgA family protein n=1 Tax=Neobacillus rhizosphaerae TaxID=2880965 RepID=UPI003D2AA04D
MVKQAFKFTLQMVILIVIYQLGNLIVRFFKMPIPGNVIGIVLLFLFLLMGIIKVDQIETAAGWLLKHLGFFFIPISVGLMTLGDTLVNKWLPLMFILIVSAFIGLLTAGKATQAVIIKNEKDKVSHHDHAI